jgi:ankyrin repeat protein
MALASDNAGRSEGGMRAISLLRANGADAADGGSLRFTPLMAASQSGATGAVALLLAHGCGDIDQQETSKGRTALHYACSAWKHEAVGVLLQAGADPHVVSLTGQRPLDLAKGEGHAEWELEVQVRACMDA